VASGLGVAYHSLSGDLAESKFSSDRTALIQERDHWRKLQGWFVRSCCDPIYSAWLEMAVLSGQVQVSLPFERLCAPHWDARSWDWVDPQKDIDASVTAIERGLSTYQQELGQQGKNWEDVFEQRAKEQARAKELSLNLDGPMKTTQTDTVKEELNADAAA
jgi:lambda family phage portal protein